MSAETIFEFECPVCYMPLKGLGKEGNTAPHPPCLRCGVWWHAGEIHTIQVGPPGAHWKDGPPVRIPFNYGEEE